MFHVSMELFTLQLQLSINNSRVDFAGGGGGGGGGGASFKYL